MKCRLINLIVITLVMSFQYCPATLVDESLVSFGSESRFLRKRLVEPENVEFTFLRSMRATEFIETNENEIDKMVFQRWDPATEILVFIEDREIYSERDLAQIRAVAEGHFLEILDLPFTRALEEYSSIDWKLHLDNPSLELLDEAISHIDQNIPAVRASPNGVTLGFFEFLPQNVLLGGQLSAFWDAPLAEDQLRHTWFGRLDDYYYPCIKHTGLGWLFIEWTKNEGVDQIFTQSFLLGAFYTDEISFPWAFAYDISEWVFLDLSDETIVWIYVPSEDRWVLSLIEL